MSEEKVPAVGDKVMYFDTEGDWAEGVITAVGELDPDTGLYPAEVDDLDIFILWSDVDDCWVEDSDEED